MKREKVPMLKRETFAPEKTSHQVKFNGIFSILKSVIATVLFIIVHTIKLRLVYQV